MDYATTNRIKAIAIISVLLSHGADAGYISCISGKWFSFFCIGGMSCFLFLSGYGLCMSYLKDGLNDFWGKRLKRILIPYAICEICLFAINFIKGQKYSFIEYLSMFTGTTRNNLVDGSMWYINFILILYVLFFVCFYLFSERTAIIIIFVVHLMCYKYIPLYFHPDYVSVQFPLGIIYAKICTKKSLEKLTFMHDVFNSKKIKYLFFVVSLVLGWMLMDNNYVYNSMEMYIKKSFASLLLMLTIIMGSLLYKLDILEIIGKKSLYIYLVEGVFIYRFNVISNIIGFNIVSYWVVLIFIALFSIILEKTHIYILKYIKNYDIVHAT